MDISADVPKRKSSFITGVWGIYNIDKSLSHWYDRRNKIDGDIRLASVNPYFPKAKVYIFGEENFKTMVDKGFDCVLVDKKPFIFDMEKEQYRHKIEIWKAGLQEFDEVVFLDWDCIPCAPIPDDFWKNVGDGAPIKSSIYRYNFERMPSRGKSGSWDIHLVSHSAFAYLRGKDICDGIIKKWEEMGRPWHEESAFSAYIDDMNGGWKGIEDYRPKYEPGYFTFYWWYPSEYVKEIQMKRNIFFHLNWNRVSKFLHGNNIPLTTKRLDEWYEREKTGITTLYNRALEKESKMKK